MGDFGLDPETALKLIQMLLRGAGYFFAGFALLGLSTYVVFLCLEIFASQTHANVRIAKVPQPVVCVRAAEQNQHLIPSETPILAETPSVIGSELLQEAESASSAPPNALR